MNRLASIAVVALLLAACGDDSAPKVEVPSWVHVAPEQIAEARKHGVPVAFENDLGMRFVLIPAGTFMMGVPEQERFEFVYAEVQDDERPRHLVRLTAPFYVQTTEVTNAQYRFLRHHHDSGEWNSHSLDGDAQPVVSVSWVESSSFAQALSNRDPVRSYRLPTEAEWEYACRAGTSTPYWSGSSEADLARVAWYRKNTQDCTVAVGLKPPNPWGLYDVHGNVWEWCMDGYAPYEAKDALDPIHPVVPGMGRVVRGGSCWNYPPNLRSADRYAEASEQRVNYVGFRLVSPLPEPGE